MSIIRIELKGEDQKLLEKVTEKLGIGCDVYIKSSVVESLCEDYGLLFKSIGDDF